MHKIGHVTLVGAGPGDPGLLTLKGKSALERADVVLVDRLVGEQIRGMIPEHADVVDVGKCPGKHLMPQETINQIILEHAQQGKRVVRLKGGDPYLFGRGAEELETVVAAGIPFEVVPGVTSAISVPAYAGIPITHRDFTSSLHIITGHSRQGSQLDIAYEHLVGLNGTLVFLMGVGTIGELAQGLTRAGMSADTPCALIENGTRPQQRQITASLCDIAALAKAEQFRPPSVLVVGAVCSLAPQLNWHARLPLIGKRVLVTRPKAASSQLTGLLYDRGCDVVELPCIRTQALPVDGALFCNMERYHWAVFTSPVGVERFFEELDHQQQDARALHGINIAAIGAKTAGLLKKNGIVADFVPANYHPGDLAAGLLSRMQPGQRALLFRAKDGGGQLPNALTQSGIAVDDIPAYETVCGAAVSDTVRRRLRDGEIDYVLFTSASTVHGFVRSLGDAAQSAFTAVCIGEQTAAAAKSYGFQVIVSAQASMESMVSCLETHAGASR